jgi:hypothetical protein
VAPEVFHLFKIQYVCLQPKFNLKAPIIVMTFVSFDIGFDWAEILNSKKAQ